MRAPSKPTNRRRSGRIAANVRTLLKERHRSIALSTADVGRHGVFLATDEPKPVRQLVQLSFELPDGPLTVMGMVARSVSEPTGVNAAGMGIEFFAMSRQCKDRWDAFYSALAQGRLGSEDLTPAAGSDQPDAPPSSARISCFLIRMQSRDRMRSYYQQEISKGSTVVRTPAPQDVSRRVEMILVHPETAAEFCIAAEVTQTLDDPNPTLRGVAVSFERLDRQHRQALESFIETGVNYLECGQEVAPLAAIPQITARLA